MQIIVINSFILTDFLLPLLSDYYSYLILDMILTVISTGYRLQHDILPEVTIQVSDMQVHSIPLAFLFGMIY